MSADPLGDLAKAKAGAAGGADPFAYFVQVGAFRTAEDAEAQRAKLALMGMDAKVTEREQSGRTVFRVRLGPYDKKEDASVKVTTVKVGDKEIAAYNGKDANAKEEKARFEKAGRMKQSVARAQRT